MKAHSSYFRQKNSKQGLALSTAMAICIVLALLVAVLVSMASLNITTTQSTVSQREAYIQAKSALAFAESYYSTHTDKIPGNGEGATTGDGLIVFNTSNISDGASVYIIGDDLNPDIIDPDTVQRYKDEAVDTYVEVTNTASVLDLTAYCKYGNGSAYKLSREFKFRSSNEARPNAFTGNIVYKPTSDTRYLRIHVRTNPAFGDQPFLYAWYTTVNNGTGEVKGKSSIVNKMSEDTNYATVSNGAWSLAIDPDTGKAEGPTGACTMTYEGNSWYVTELKFSTNQNVNFVNAIVARRGAVRSEGNNAQSWEFFGIPVPDQRTTGEANGLDVYITLNQSSLLDMRNSGSNDEFTKKFESMSGSGEEQIKNFVQFCSSWYTVYTKKETATIHYREANVYDNSSGLGGSFAYEGYGWWRITSNNLSDSVEINGKSFRYDQGAIISENEYGKERVMELYVVRNGDDYATFGSESEANNQLSAWGDTKAGDYITVNVKSNSQPVNDTVETKITYNSEWIESGSEMPTPDNTSSTPKSSGNGNEVAYGNEELQVQKLASTAVQPSGVSTEYAVIGFPNNWGRDADDGDNCYDYLHGDILDSLGNFEYSRTYTNLTMGSYSFKVIEMQKSSGLIKDDSIGFDGWKKAYGNGTGDYVVNVSKAGNNIIIKFNSQTNTVTAYEEDPDGGGGGNNPYVIAGWMNDFGRSKDGYTNTTNVYELTDDMTYSGGAYTYTSGILNSGKNYTFKILEKLATSGSISEKHGWDEGHAYGGSGANGDADGNFVLHMDNDSEGNVISYYVDISFDVANKSINVLYHIMGSSADDTYYLVGTFNNWADHKYDKALAYPLTMTGKDAEGHPVYTLKITDTFEAGQLYEFKVISSRSQLTEPDSEGKTIDYEYSWGAPDAAQKTQGSDKVPFSFTLDQRSKITIQFTFNKEYSTITYTPKVIDPYDIVGTVDVGFHNGVLENINDHTKTEFTTPWDQVYVTYETPENFYCFPLDMNGTDVWGKVPEDAEYIYFSNMPTENYGDPGYEYTENIESSKFVGITNPIFFPISPTTNSIGVLWSFGDTSEYSKWTSIVKNITATEVMAYTGSKNSSGYYASSQNNYYDAPIVKVLNMLVTGTPDAGGAYYAYAAYPYSDFDVGGGVGTITFDSGSTVTYQGEVYYYKNVSKGYKASDGKRYSFLIIQNSQAPYKGGILLENCMALTSDKFYGGVKINMDNRGGGVFTSDSKYYNGEDSVFNYKGYTPSWYTYKIPVSTELTIQKITGVTKKDTDFLNNSSNRSFTPAKAGENYNQPLYIYQSASGLGYYTYNTDTGNVDTTKSDTSSIYFNDTEGWGEVWIHAYNALGKSEDKKLDIDDSDSDTSYYKFPFSSGDYCYFVFYDHTDNSDYTLASKKTPVHYFTGNENESRQYQILAVGRDSGLTWYLHPKTKALYAYQDLRAAVAATSIPEYYGYNAQTAEYVASSETLKMTQLEAKASAAKAYAESGSCSNSGCADYSDLAAAAIEYSQAISNARIYISEEVPDSVKTAGTDTFYTGSGGIYREGAYKDDIVTYETRWVNALKNIYTDAIGVYSNTSSQESASVLRQKAANLNALINAPETVLNPDAVQIIVDDQKGKDASGNASGLWGKSNIHLYNRDGADWRDIGYDLYDTTQSNEGYYAYIFKLNLTTSNVFQIAKSLPDSSDSGETLAAGNRYIFHTATGTFERDTSVHTITCTYTTIKEGDFSEAYREFTSAADGEEFVVYFKNDTEVISSEANYTIYAGAYMISSKTYVNFNSDVPGKSGINLFTDGAKTFFTTPGRYGMSSKTGYDSSWVDNIDKTSSMEDIDIMVESVGNPGGTLSAKTATNSTVAFRYDGRTGQDKLTLAQNIELKGGIVSVAANNIVIPSSWDVTIDAKTIVFHTDTMVTTPSGETFRVAHGTYIFNESADSTASAVIELSSTGGTGGKTDWRDHYILIDEVASELRGGTYVVKN